MGPEFLPLLHSPHILNESLPSLSDEHNRDQVWESFFSTYIILFSLFLEEEVEQMTQLIYLLFQNVLEGLQKKFENLGRES